jgi:hypothetical protein
MPIEYRIDHNRRLVLAEGRGVLSDEDVFEYQRAVWLRAEVAGYDELMDMRMVERINVASADRVGQLAALSASMDVGRASKFAIVAPQDLAFGLGRMYQTFRGLEESSTKEVGVFRTLDEAMAFLSTEGEGSD